MAWFTRNKPPTEGGGEGERHVRTEGLWLKCDHCSQIVWRKALEENLQVCPKCEHHFRIDAPTRLKLLFDNEQFETHEAGMASTDPLRFVDAKPYKERLASLEKQGLRDAVISATGKLDGRTVNICALEL